MFFGRAGICGSAWQLEGSMRGHHIVVRMCYGLLTRMCPPLSRAPYSQEPTGVFVD